jgi:hypothetical protein
MLLSRPLLPNGKTHRQVRIFGREKKKETSFFPLKDTL